MQTTNSPQFLGNWGVFPPKIFLWNVPMSNDETLTKTWHVEKNQPVRRYNADDVVDAVADDDDVVDGDDVDGDDDDRVMTTRMTMTKLTRRLMLLLLLPLLLAAAADVDDPFIFSRSHMTITFPRYISPEFPDYVEYLRFSDDIEESFTVKGKRSEPLLARPSPALLLTRLVPLPQI